MGFFESFLAGGYFGVMSGMIGLPSDSVSEVVIGASFEVAKTLGPGFLEKVYDRALGMELELRGLRVARQVALPVYYKNQLAGDILRSV